MFSFRTHCTFCICISSSHHCPGPGLFTYSPNGCFRVVVTISQRSNRGNIDSNTDQGDNDYFPKIRFTTTIIVQRLFIFLKTPSPPHLHLLWCPLFPVVLCRDNSSPCTVLTMVAASAVLRLLVTVMIMSTITPVLCGAGVYLRFAHLCHVALGSFTINVRRTFRFLRYF